MSKRIRKEDAWKQVKIDGDTLEKRREQRNEQLLRYAETMSEESKKGILGYVTQWDPERGVRGVRTSQALYGPEARRIRTDQPVQVGNNMTAVAPDDAFKLDPIRKRTPDERIESMTKRLLKAHPQDQEYLLKSIGAEYWKKGMPVTVDQLRAAAAHYLNKAERKK